MYVCVCTYTHLIRKILITKDMVNFHLIDVGQENKKL